MTAIKVTELERKTARLIETDPYLAPYRETIRKWLRTIEDTSVRLLSGGVASLTELATGHTYYGLHCQGDHWVFREWAPNAASLYLIGDFSGWQAEETYRLRKINTNGDWEITLPIECLRHGMHYRLHLRWLNGEGERIPAYARRVVQDPDTGIFTAQVWSPDKAYHWCHQPRRTNEPPLFIYEAHIGMAQEAEQVGSYREFTREILPRITAAGYDTLQLMALSEHPYYGLFRVPNLQLFCGLFTIRDPGRIERTHRHGSRPGTEGTHGPGALPCCRQCCRGT